MRFTRILLIVVLLFLPVSTQAVGSTEIGNQRYIERVAIWEEDLKGLEYVTREVIVEFNDIRSLSSIEAATIEGFEISEVFQYRPVAVLRVNTSESIPEALARLEGCEGIRSVGPNLIRRCTFTPNDPMLDRQKYHIPIHSEAAWDMTVGSASVNVATIDTGLDIEHPELAGRIIYQENLFDPEAQGAENVFDDSGHGTGVAGIIAAQGNNVIGIAGMAWDIRILAFRACGGPDLECTLADEVQAIDSAVAHGADVINLSLGGPGTTVAEQQAVQDAYNAGVVIVAASGNGNPGGLYEFTGDPAYDNAHMYYPAAFPEVIGVAALDNNNGAVTDPAALTRADFSNYGEDIVSVAAVGTHVYTTVPFRPRAEVPHAIYPTRNYAYLAGTSFACPQVAGVACLLLSRYPSASPLDIRALIEQTALPMGGPDFDHNGIDDHMGYGVLDAGAALGNAVGSESVFQNGDFLVGVVRSSLFVDDIFVIVRCKRGSDEPPHVSYFVQATAENDIVAMELLPAHSDTYLGRFHTTGFGNITIHVTGILTGVPLEALSIEYMLVD